MKSIWEYIDNMELKRNAKELARVSYNKFNETLSIKDFESFEADTHDYINLTFETIVLISNCYKELGLTFEMKERTIKGYYKDITDNLKSLTYQKERVL